MEKNGKNGFKRVTPQGWLAVLIIIGFVATWIASLKAVPELRATVQKNCIKISNLERDILYIREGIGEIKDILKEK